MPSKNWELSSLVRNSKEHEIMTTHLDKINCAVGNKWINFTSTAYHVCMSFFGRNVLSGGSSALRSVSVSCGMCKNGRPW